MAVEMAMTSGTSYGEICERNHILMSFPTIKIIIYRIQQQERVLIDAFDVPTTVHDSRDRKRTAPLTMALFRQLLQVWGFAASQKRKID